MDKEVRLPRFNPNIEPKEDPAMAKEYTKRRDHWVRRVNHNQRIGDLLLGGFTAMVFVIVAHMVAGR
jgi:hypothetical protein